MTDRPDLVLPDPGRASDASASSDVPAELIEHAAQRLGMFAGLIIVVGLIEMVSSHGYALLSDPEYPTRVNLFDLTGVAVALTMSLTVVLAVRRRWLPALPLLRVGLVYLLLLAYVMSCTDHADYFWKGGQGLHGLPNIVVLILLFPVLIPSTPPAAACVALMMAATGPLSLWTLQAVLHYEPPSTEALLDSFPWLGALVAGAMADIVHDLGKRLKRAQTLGAYTLEERLGGGGMGEVFRARHTLLARSAAIKLIRPTRDPDATTRERFKREARATAALKSPHTVALYDFGVSRSGSFYYVMELLEGYDLEVLVQRFGPLPPERVVHLLVQICHSLREAHAIGLVHRDIKPANVMVCRYGLDHDFVKLLDFGLVTWRTPLPLEDARLTGTEEVRGTPAFMAPELVLQSAPVDAQTDLYALGCVAFWLLTGHYVFQGKTPIEVIVGHVHDTPPAPSTLTREPVPEALERIVLACLAKAPGDRPAGAEGLLALLGECSFETPWSAATAKTWWDEHAKTA